MYVLQFKEFLRWSESDIFLQKMWALYFVCWKMLNKNVFHITREQIQENTMLLIKLLNINPFLSLKDSCCQLQCVTMISDICRAFKWEKIKCRKINVEASFILM